MSETNFLKAYKANVEHVAKGTPSKIRRVRKLDLWDVFTILAFLSAVCIGFAFGYGMGTGAL